MIACIPFKDTKRMVEISPCCYLYPGVRDKIFGLQNAGTVSSAGNLSSSMEAIFISVTNSRTISRYRRNPIARLRTNRTKSSIASGTVNLTESEDPLANLLSLETKQILMRRSFHDDELPKQIGLMN
ncbi:578_t:CDS:2 [Entrophospora sp. SA101]|nr:14997_t:CDS:2 [Entrophospora sp. SA101]CAJ0918806.1 578_t:CDS:2 [Entrophospora sp. SA101]